MVAIVIPDMDSRLPVEQRNTKDFNQLKRESTFPCQASVGWSRTAGTFERMSPGSTIPMNPLK
jgi:hypothetical protein